MVERGGGGGSGKGIRWFAVLRMWDEVVSTSKPAYATALPPSHTLIYVQLYEASTHLFQHAALDPDCYEQVAYSKGCFVGCLRACLSAASCSGWPAASNHICQLVQLKQHARRQSPAAAECELHAEPERCAPPHVRMNFANEAPRPSTLQA